MRGARDKQYVVETPPKVLERCLLMTTDPGDLVLDLTCGSGAMPFQAETWGRRWIAIDVAQVSIAIARERLITRQAFADADWNTYPYHMLKDSPEGAKLDHEMEQAFLPAEKKTPFEGKALLQQARAFQKSESFAEYRSRRQVVEHRLARLVQLGVRRIRAQTRPTERSQGPALPIGNSGSPLQP